MHFLSSVQTSRINFKTHCCPPFNFTKSINIALLLFKVLHQFSVMQSTQSTNQSMYLSFSTMFLVVQVMIKKQNCVHAVLESRNWFGLCCHLKVETTQSMCVIFDPVLRQQ